MNLTLAGKSILLFGASLLLLGILTLLDPVLAGLPTAVQRLVALFGLVVPGVVGAGLGAMSLVHKEGRAWLAVIGILLNSLFALFHLAVVLFAG